MTSFQRLRREARKKSKNKGHKLGFFIEKENCAGIFIAKCVYCNRKVVLDNNTINDVFMEKNIKPIKVIRGVLRGDPLSRHCKGAEYLKDKTLNVFYKGGGSVIVGGVSTASTTSSSITFGTWPSIFPSTTI